MADIDQVKAPTPSFSTPTLVAEYIGMLSSLERMLRARGIPVVAIGEGGSRFETLPQEQQAAIVQGVTKFYGLCNRIDELDKDKTDLSCVWWVIKELGLRPPHDLFEKLTGDDIIEIYEPSGLQIFRSFNMFRYISYTLDQLFTYEWWQLFERDAKVTEAMFEIAKKLLTGQLKDYADVDLPAHAVKEVFGPEKRVAMMKNRFGCTLFGKDNQPACFMSVFRIVGDGQMSH